MLLDHERVARTLDRLCDLTTDVRNLYRPFVSDTVVGETS